MKLEFHKKIACLGRNREENLAQATCRFQNLAMAGINCHDSIKSQLLALWVLLWQILRVTGRDFPPTGTVHTLVVQTI